MNYNFHDLNDDVGFRDRYRSDSIEGFSEFNDLVEEPSIRLLNQLKSKRSNQPNRPTVFISHKQQDKVEALKVMTWINNLNGYDTWIDVLDPNLAKISLINKEVEALLIAAIIEIALINCSHVLVVYTAQTKGSSWVPYEYGRISDSPYDWSRAACYSPDVSVPAYMRLGVVTSNRREVEDWLQQELLKWNKP